MKGNSRKAYKPLKNLSNDPTKPEQAHNEITANQVAHQLLMNGKTNKRIPKTKLERNIANEKKFLNDDFCIRELQEAIKMMKNNKAAGIDGIRTEQIDQTLQIGNTSMDHKIPESFIIRTRSIHSFTFHTLIALLL
jgi:hypothetical protein